MSDYYDVVLEQDERIEELESEIVTLKEQNKKYREVLEMVEDPRKMPHQHEDLRTRLYCLAERAREVLNEDV